MKKVVKKFEVYQKSLPIQNYVVELENEFASQSKLDRGSEEFQEKWLEYFESYKQELMAEQDYAKVSDKASLSELDERLVKFQMD